MSGREPQGETYFGGKPRDVDPVVWLLAQSAARDAEPDPQTPKGTSPLASPSWAARIFPFMDSGEPVGLAPARWGGTVSLEYLGHRGDDGERRNLLTSAVSLFAASYFWQPWFAQVRGTLTILGSAESIAGRDSGTGDAGGTAHGLSLSGGGTLTVFPSSRFPFLASFDSTDSRSTGEFAASEQRNTRASLRQSWQDPLGTTTYVGSLDYSAIDSSAFGRDSVVQLDTRYLGAFAPHRFDAALAWSRNRRNAGRDGSDIFRAFGTHVYTPTPDLWVTSLASFTDTALDTGGAGRGFTQRVGQLTSQAVWRPEFDDRIVVNGGGRAFVNQFAGGGPDSTAHSLSGNAGVSFAVSDSATLFAALNATHFSGLEGAGSLVRFANAGANYVSPSLDLGVANYSVNASLQGGHQSGGREEPRNTASAQADQQISRSLSFGKAATLTLVANQGAGISEDSILGRTNTLRAGGSAGLRVVTSESSDGYLGAQVGQSESRGATNDSFRLANLQASGQARFGSSDSLSANVTAQWTRSRRDRLAAEESSRQIFGGVTYTHGRLFGVPRLRYQFSATFNEGIQGPSRLLGDVDAARENVSQLLEQRLLYDIGRLELRIGMRLAKIEGRDDLQWYLRVHRQMGQY